MGSDSRNAIIVEGQQSSLSGWNAAGLAKKEHWARIFAGMQKPFAPDTAYTLEGLQAWKIFDYKKLIEEQSAIATGEANLQATIDKIDWRPPGGLELAHEGGGGWVGPVGDHRQGDLG